MKKSNWKPAAWLDRILSLPGRALANLLTRESREYTAFAVHDVELLAKTLKPCDILLVEGNQHISGAIKYLTQSTWSHSAMYVGNIIAAEDDDPKMVIEADIKLGVIGRPLSHYTRFNTRICRPVGLTAADKTTIINYMMKHLGMAYDLKNVLDLARYLFPTPPVPKRFRRRLIALGSGDPTRAICSSLIAQAFHAVDYPILPEKIETEEDFETLYSIRHHSLFTPRDFDLSPYFKIVKPTLTSHSDFNHRKFSWQDKEKSENG